MTIRNMCVFALGETVKDVPVVKQGEVIVFETNDCFNNQITDENYVLDALDWEHINPATGPVYIEGAEKGDVLKVELSGPDMGIVIGNRGETLDALQHLTSLVVNKGDGEFMKVSLDAENYREKRNEALESLAHKLAAKVMRTRRNTTLEPMNAYERRIIHSALQDHEAVTTYSVGQGINRKVVIALKRDEK